MKQVVEQLETCPSLAGVMMGRGVTQDPWNTMGHADVLLYQKQKDRLLQEDVRDDNNRREGPRNRLELLQEFGAYADEQEQQCGIKVARRHLVKAIANIFDGKLRSKKYKQELDRISRLNGTKRHPKPSNGDANGNLELELPLSQLIIHAARGVFSEEILLESPPTREAQ